MLQHSPNFEPRHVIPLGEAPLALPHRALVETEIVGEGNLEEVVVLWPRPEEVEEGDDLEHVPCNGLHSVPQCSLELPHHPY